MFNLRTARPADAPEIARVHVASWRTIYRGIVPQSALDGLNVEQRSAFWQSMLEDAARRGFDVVAESANGEIVGFASGGPERTGHQVFRGELYAVYLLAEFQRLRLGRRLVSAIARRLADGGYGTMLVWVLAANPASHFYEALGGQPIMRQPITIGGVELEEVAYGWINLKDLLP